MIDIPPIQQLLPHDSPMILIDKVESWDDDGITTIVTIRHDSLFLEENGVPAWVGIEYMGQTIAAHAGLLARREGEPVRIGFLVSTRHYQPNCSHFPVGEQLLVSAKSITFNETGLKVFKCQIHSDNITAQANLNVFMPENVEDFLQGETN